ncbi:MAG TPA: hypothetical protein VFL61_09460 [Gaiellaceae bacterium]|nr:hypothetical protein [Gaiellaceae bacterium]
MRPNAGFCRLSRLEIAAGLVFGLVPQTRLPVPFEMGTQTPQDALERAILPALMRPPCLMSFSGGGASSAILAVAVQLARREGLELPVPATNRVDGAAGRDERSRQERVIIHLGLTEWVRLEFADELDLVGPVAMRVLRRQGFLWPFNAHFSMPLIEWAAGGSLITGLGYHPFGEPASLLCRDPDPLPWLWPSAQSEIRARLTADAASEARAEQYGTAWWGRLRRVQVGIELLRRLGAEQRVEVCHPFMDPVFSTALDQLPMHRRSTHALFGNLLPLELFGRPTTSTHWDACWGSYSRELAEAWQGEGVDLGLVDPEALQRQWSLPRPHPRTFLLLQSVALAQESLTASRVVSAAGSQPD